MTSLKVTGMHCEGCENKIQKMVGKIEGISDVKADRKKETVIFDFDGSTQTLSAVKKKIDELGYEVVQ